MSIANPQALLSLLQLASPTLPVGAYSYSEGLEALVEQRQMTRADDLAHWLTQELTTGAIRLEAAAMLRAYHGWAQGQAAALRQWNDWLSALREPEEMRRQSWQMGRSLLRLFKDLDPEAIAPLSETFQATECNFAIAFGITAQHWGIAPADAVLAYLQSWVTNLISAGIKLIPLGQTEGQRLLRAIAPTLEAAAIAVQTLADDDLLACSWGITLASMNHETQYSRLFRS